MQVQKGHNRIKMQNKRCEIKVSRIKIGGDPLTLGGGDSRCKCKKVTSE